MNKEIDEKKCENCRYYVRHFSKQGAAFQTICCGHCKNHNNKKMAPYGVCGYWEDIALQKEERARSIKAVLRNMSERLNEIAMVLKDDEID